MQVLRLDAPQLEDYSRDVLKHIELPAENRRS